MANDLIDVRERVARRTGHHEFVTDFAAGIMTLAAGSPVDQFINTAQRGLDRRLGQPQMRWHLIELAVDDFVKSVAGLRYAKEVWVADVEKRTQLGRQTVEELRANFSAKLSTLTKARPKVWSPAPRTTHPITLADTFTQDDDDILFNKAAGWEDTGILFYPPADKAYTMRILGAFYSTTLAIDADESWWSVNHIDTLVEGSILEVEKQLHRNQEGINIWERSLSTRVREIYNDIIAVEAEAYTVDEMEMEG